MTASSFGSRVQIGVSRIHGKGLFACKRLRNGAYIATFEGEPTDEDGMHVLWLTDENGLEQGIDGKNALRFLNHSLDPNAEFRGADLHATRNIQPGREVTIHYGDAWEDEA